MPDKQSISIKMKTGNIVSTALLTAAVVVLFILHFSDGTQKESTGTADSSSAGIEASDIRIAYFNMDSVMANWNLYFEYQQELGQKQTQLETDFAGKTENFYQSVQDAKYKIQRGLVTRNEAKQLEEQLASEEQNLQVLQNQYMAQLQEEGLVKNRKMLDMIEQYVAELSEAKGYHYVYSYSFGGNLIYGARSFDITDDVVDGLNEKYTSETEESK
ncbi:MAG: hypothetical protein CSA96_01730 [Bacteroidetes bacterium]|nr:MAG: hypothetical protein CSA96_01730 [Bacteroidota bacterium]